MVSNELIAIIINSVLAISAHVLLFDAKKRSDAYQGKKWEKIVFFSEYTLVFVFILAYILNPKGFGPLIFITAMLINYEAFIDKRKNEYWLSIVILTVLFFFILTR